MILTRPQQEESIEFSPCMSNAVAGPSRTGPCVKVHDGAVIRRVYFDHLADADLPDLRSAPLCPWQHGAREKSRHRFLTLRPRPARRCAEVAHGPQACSVGLKMVGLVRPPHGAAAPRVFLDLRSASARRGLLHGRRCGDTLLTCPKKESMSPGSASWRTARLFQ